MSEKKTAEVLPTGAKGWADCPTCKYHWPTKVESPKSCPRCKARLDRGVKN